MTKIIYNYLKNNAHYLAWFIALLATVASFSLSEIFNLPPCVLCWWQRIFMYPLVIIIGVGIMRKDKNWPFTALPFTILGGLVALFHTLIQWQIIPDQISFCSVGVSCTTVQINWLGFITIPFMSLISFVVLMALTLIYKKAHINE